MIPPSIELIDFLVAEWQKIYLLPVYYLYSEFPIRDRFEGEWTSFVTQWLKSCRNCYSTHSIVRGMIWECDRSKTGTDSMWQTQGHAIICGDMKYQQAVETLSRETLKVMKRADIMAIVGRHCPHTQLSVVDNENGDVWQSAMRLEGANGGIPLVPIRDDPFVGDSIGDWCRLTTMIATKQKIDINCMRFAFCQWNNRQDSLMVDFEQRLAYPLPPEEDGSYEAVQRMRQERWLACPGGYSTPDTMGVVAVAVLRWVKSLLLDSAVARETPQREGATERSPAGGRSAGPATGYLAFAELVTAFSVPKADTKAFKQRLQRLKERYPGDQRLWQQVESGARGARFIFNASDQRVRDAALPARDRK